MPDPYGLQRFVDAQADTYERALAELRRGRKTSHWMWFVFPQIAGLGSSAMAQLYAIGSAAEARAYAGHPLLGPRLGTCTSAVLGHAGLSALDIFGRPDDVKFRSCMTLFAETAPHEPVFAAALDTFFCGSGDPLTTEMLRRMT